MNSRFNTGETSQELRDKYNPDNSVLRKAQLRMLDMLIYIDNICKEQNIKYSLDGGNVLGAIRHGGFIPWDDDVDIILERKEYKRLCNYLLKNPHPQYVLQTPKTDPMFINHWNVLRDTQSEYLQDSVIHNVRKYRGLQIDIFPIENRVIPFFHKLVNILHYKNVQNLLIKSPLLAKLLYYVNKTIIIPIIRCISYFVGDKNLYTYGYGLPWIKWIYPKNVLFPYAKIKFENYTFSGPANPVEFLKIHYGKYMDLPIENNRNHHQANYKIYN